MKKDPIFTIIWIIVFITTIITYYFFDKTKSDWLLSLWGVIGTNLSIIGIGYTLFQIKQLRSESRIIKDTTRETKEKINNLNGYADIAKGIKLIQEIQGYARAKKHEAGVMRLQELKIIVSQAKFLNSRSSAPVNIKSVIQNLNELINGMEKEISNNGTSLKSAKVNFALEEILDLLIEIQSNILQSD